ncbi:hypothetical protein AOLI_G00272480 [Acnodon oligacanthus]
MTLPNLTVPQQARALTRRGRGLSGYKGLRDCDLSVICSLKRSLLSVDTAESGFRGNQTLCWAKNTRLAGHSRNPDLQRHPERSLWSGPPWTLTEQKEDPRLTVVVMTLMRGSRLYGHIIELAGVTLKPSVEETMAISVKTG